MKIKVSNTEAVVKRAFFLAWQACRGPLGMGVFQDNPGANEDAVWNNIARRGDYRSMEKIAGPGVKGDSTSGEAYGDYVFGRMMKLSIKWKDGEIDVNDSVPRADYQAWCVKYPTYEDLIQAAIKSL